jgi:hypothetical protein
MHRPLLTLLLVASSVTLGCDQRPTQPSEVAAGKSATTALTPAAAPVAEFTYARRFDPDNFVRKVDNRFFPLVPGTRYVVVGEEDGEPVTNVTLVTHDRKNILGVSAIVVFDRVLVHGELKEKTFDWYAQDKQGNVWYLGEDTKEFEDGKVVSTAGSWEAGVKGARAGIIMPAHPQTGQHYRQEFFRGEAEDEARVTGVGVELTVPYGSFRGCIRTIEWTRLEPGITEAKFYCPDVGFVKARGVEGSDARLVLKNVFH